MNAIKMHTVLCLLLATMSCSRTGDKIEMLPDVLLNEQGNFTITAENEFDVNYYLWIPDDSRCPDPVVLFIIGCSDSTDEMLSGRFFSVESSWSNSPYPGVEIVGYNHENRKIVVKVCEDMLLLEPGSLLLYDKRNLKLLSESCSYLHINNHDLLAELVEKALKHDQVAQ